MTNFTPDQWVILGLVFVLGLLVGMWATSGGRRKWKNRYTEEQEKRRTLERDLKERDTVIAQRDKDLREADALHHSATRSRGAAAGAPVADRPVGSGPYDDRDRDGFRDRPIGDRDGDGYRDRPLVGGGRRPGDVDGDGVPNRGDRHPADDRRF
ncbi:hypothetical protein OMW55_04920 [Sphingomonas sp. BN140010]|uniref:Uncharacterized protein n=1 Tax=Sphingomonas arvum TaxID=2992113 RepID=A0ABT3JE11_9SPHN|nr:hypothetical protein [Sphingomonas sp. BN140010]MCW3797149.1 hypothetical protein [Sphingomonas sp. BN140010]